MILPGRPNFISRSLHASSGCDIVALAEMHQSDPEHRDAVRKRDWWTTIGCERLLKEGRSPICSGFES
jgi:hypothetical protein